MNRLSTVLIALSVSLCGLTAPGRAASLSIVAAENFYGDIAADETLRTVISWARYAELFSYDDDAEMLSLENPTHEG